MKSYLLLCLIIPAFLGSCNREKVSPLEGAWKLAFEYEISGDQTNQLYPGDSRGSEIKVWAGDRWALVGVYIKDTTVTDNFGGGKFTLEGTSYREIVEYHSAEEYLGQTVKLYLQIKNDTLTQIWPVDEQGEPVRDHHYMEKWVKFR